MTERRARKAKTDTTETCMGIDGSQAVQAAMISEEWATPPSKVEGSILFMARKNQRRGRER